MAKKTTNKVTHLSNLIIVDASGSMQSKKDEVKGGLKQLFEQIQKDAKKDKKKTLSSTIVTDFSSSGDFRTLISSKDSLSLDQSVADQYTTRGMTALYDAIAKSFALVPTDADAVFVNIITDGLENDSKEISSENVKALVKEKKDKNWTITFMGTSEASLDAAVNFGIMRSNTSFFADTKEGTKKALKKALKARSTYYVANMEYSLLSEKERGIVSTKMDSLMDDTKDDE